jgi:hypothetical protein
MTTDPRWRCAFTLGACYRDNLGAYELRGGHGGEQGSVVARGGEDSPLARNIKTDQHIYFFGMAGRRNFGAAAAVEKVGKLVELGN